MVCINPSIRSTLAVPKGIETSVNIVGVHNVAEKGDIYSFKGARCVQVKVEYRIPFVM